MIALRKTFLTWLMLLTTLLLLALACNFPREDAPTTPIPTEIPATREARETQEAIADATRNYEIDNYIIDPQERDQAMSDPDDKLTLAYEGENQSYHTGLRNRTVFYIDYDTNAVVADESDSFEEASGELTRRGTDTVTFSGWYHSANNTIQGRLTIFTEGTAVGAGERADWTNTVTYSMSGDVMMWYENGEWTGQVEGTATLKQTWPSGRFSDEVATNKIYWDITGVPLK
jgi:hypothetical protein